MKVTVPHLETERLLLSLGDLALAPVVATYLKTNRAFLAPWEPTRPDSFFTADHWREQIPRNHAEFRAGAAVRLFVTMRSAPQLVIGMVNVTGIARGPAQFGYVGYSLAETLQGYGFMAEALKAAIAYMFDEWRLHRLMAAYMPHNVRSANVLKKLGFAVEGHARDYLRIAGRWEDHVLTALTNPDWQPPD
jgi:ribosomal-protein-alanine N-acetyltransferase